MNVLIVESKEPLSRIWAAHLERQGAHVDLAHHSDGAMARLCATAYDVVVLDLVLEGGGALAVADYVQYRHPNSKIVFVTDTTFFSDGSIFRMIPNAAGFLQAETPPEDLAALVEHHGRVD